MPICSFCKRQYNFPRGLTVYTTDGRIVYFCSSKCRKNADLKRDPKKVNWIRKRKDVKAEVSSKLKKKEDLKEELSQKVKK